MGFNLLLIPTFNLIPKLHEGAENSFPVTPACYPVKLAQALAGIYCVRIDSRLKTSGMTVCITVRIYWDWYFSWRMHLDEARQVLFVCANEFTSTDDEVILCHVALPVL